MCGVIGIIGPQSKGTSELGTERPEYWAAYEAYRGLLTLQHRGQDAAGILTFDHHRQKFYQEKDLGLIASVFDQSKVEGLSGDMALAHTRYATTGSDGKGDLQPLVTGVPFGAGMVHNGNILNYHSLATKLNRELNFQLLTNNDLELLLHLWCNRIMQERGVGTNAVTFDHCIKAAQTVVDEATGGYALVGMMANTGLFGLRDPNGIRPLVLGKRLREDGQYDYCLSSETLALNFLGFERERDIAPGEIILITEDGQVHSHVVEVPKKASHCMFEWIYFAGAESAIENKSVYGTRLNLGHVLAKKVKVLIDNKEVNPDFVCPVPDTSRTASIALAESLELPYREGLIKNRYVQRSFILSEQDKREKAVELKLSPVRSEIEGKNILLVDDSVVRGTTSKKIIELLKRFGAKEITLAITCPPLRYGCFYGIDFPTPTELIANGKNLEEIATWVGANRVIYLDEEDLVEAIGTDQLCMACINNNYPTEVSEGVEFARRRNELKR
jgi:amidophosphoribosyltransferase